MADAIHHSEEVTQEAESATVEPRPAAPPIESRFLFVDVAAMRAKQLRKGALQRLDDLSTSEVAPAPVRPVKSERVAMEEVRRGLVLYDVPDPPKPAVA
jgi:DNA-directed RNA polymerase subunit K/omega